LAFWTGGDAARMDRLFRQSGLMRAKWDEVHFADGATYGEQTIERALEEVPFLYLIRNDLGTVAEGQERHTSCRSLAAHL
jgi:primase-polymerase (primpol)-like protein